jgi:hypothetical protein
MHDVWVSAGQQVSVMGWTCFSFVWLNLPTARYLLFRVPGNFHIQMGSKHHNINPTAANLSHIVNSLSFGTVLPKNAVNRLSTVPRDYFNLDSTQLMNGNIYRNDKLHQSFHHYIKVVATNVDAGFKEPILAYQMVQSSQMMKVRS